MDSIIDKFMEFLESLPKTKYATERDFLSTVVPTFVSYLGYSTSELFFEVSYRLVEGYRLIADAVITEERTRPPWILIETKVPRGGRYLKGDMENWKRRLDGLRHFSQAEYAVILSPLMIFLLVGREWVQYSLDTISYRQAFDFYHMLQRPSSFIHSKPTYSEDVSISDINTETFSLKMAEYLKWLDLVRNASTNDEKKQSFEGLAKLLFDGIPFLSCKALDLRTSSSEIDIVLEYCGWHKPTLFSDLGRFCLVECKNWQAPISAKHVRDFKGKLDKTKLKLGILFARKGITGAEKGGDAVREITSMFDRDDIHILVVAEEDLEEIQRGANFYELLDQKMFQLKFDAILT